MTKSKLVQMDAPKNKYLVHGLKVGKLALILALMSLILQPSPADAAPSENSSETVRILPLKILSDVLDESLTNKLAAKLERLLGEYSNMETLPTPNVDVLELLLENDCIEPDLECLVAIGASRKVDMVFFVTVTEQEDSYTLGFQVVDVKSSAIMKKGERSSKRLKRLNKNMTRVVRDAFGKPGPPPSKEVAFSILSPIFNARVTLDGKAVGTTPLNTKVKPGSYTMEVKKKGFQPYVEEITIHENKVFRRRVRLDAIAVKAPPATDPVTTAQKPIRSSTGQDSEAIYEKWWFWAATGAVVVTATTIIILSTQGDDAPETGSLLLSLQPSEVESDAIFIQP